MKFGFYLPNQGPTARPEPLAAIAKKGDELGFYCMVAGDHILVPDVIDSPYPYTVGGVFHPVGFLEYRLWLLLPGASLRLPQKGIWAMYARRAENPAIRLGLR